MSMAYTTLMACVKRFDPNHGLSFFAASKPFLRGALSRYWRQLDVVKNASYHRQRKADAKGEDVETQTFVDVPEDIIQTDPDWSGIRTRELYPKVIKLMNKKLGARERCILLLAYEGGMNFQEIADLFGVSRSAVQWIHARALETVRCELHRSGALLGE